MEYEWNIHRIFMDYSWNIHGFFMDYSWTNHGICLWGCNGTMMGYPETQRVLKRERIKLNGGLAIAMFDYHRNICIIHNTYNIYIYIIFVHRQGKGQTC